MLMNLLWVVGISLGGGFALRVWATPERIEQNASAWTLCMVLLMVFIALGVTHGLAPFGALQTPQGNGVGHRVLRQKAPHRRRLVNRNAEHLPIFRLVLTVKGIQ
jgi:hypothetical protein